jgi:hypothetical protein
MSNDPWSKDPWCVGESVGHHSQPMKWDDETQRYLCEFCGLTTLGIVAGYDRTARPGEVIRYYRRRLAHPKNPPKK